jgi:hypothetical protein
MLIRMIKNYFKVFSFLVAMKKIIFTLSCIRPGRSCEQVKRETLGCIVRIVVLVVVVVPV